MSRYIYKGRSKLIKKIPEKINKENILIDSCAFIIIASSPISNTKKLGCPLINEHFGTEVLDFHLDVIKMVCKHPEIVIVGGFEVKKVLKHSRREEYIVVENLLHEMTNSAEDLKIGLNASRCLNTCVIDGNLVPSLMSYKLLLEEPMKSSILYSNRRALGVGCEIGNENYVSYYSYKSDNKLKGAMYLSQTDSARMRKKILGSTFNKNKFDFELLDETRMLAKNDTSQSVRIDEDFDED